MRPSGGWLPRLPANACCRSKMRVIAGRAKGTRLKVPKRLTRPSTDRLREALFSILGPRLPDARVLDLFAGSGALGIEALSRGAGSAVFVESNRNASMVIEENLEKAGFREAAGAATLLSRDVFAVLRTQSAPFDLIFADPPYASTGSWRVLSGLVTEDLLEADARVVVEHARGNPLPPVQGLEREEERRYGETVVTRLRRNPSGGVDAE